MCEWSMISLSFNTFKIIDAVLVYPSSKNCPTLKRLIEVFDILEQNILFSKWIVKT